MIKVKFNNDDKFYSVNFRKKSDHVVYLIGSCPVNRTGFIAYKDDGETVLGDYSNYTTIYRQLSDGVQFSDDGSVWHEPEKNVEFYVLFNDSGYPIEDRPDEIKLIIANDKDSDEEEITVTSNNLWIGYVYNKPESYNYYIKSGEDIANFSNAIISEDTIVYTNIKPSWQDRMESQIFYTAMETDTLLEE